MAFKGVCSYRVFSALLVHFIFCLPSTDSFTLRLPTAKNNTITVENGVESNVDFFLNDYPSLNQQIKIIVQHKRGAGLFDRICQILHSKTSGCARQFGPCQCVGESPGSSYQYQLKMIFTNQDVEQLLFEIVSHIQIVITVNVHESVPTTFKPTRVPTPVARPATTRPPAIPTTTSTTVVTTRLVEVATAAGTTHHVLHVSSPDHHETPNNSVDRHDNEENGEDHDKEKSMSSQSENKEEEPKSSGSKFVAMNTITISFLVIASQWELM